MPVASTKKKPAKASSLSGQLQLALQLLQEKSTQHDRDNLARFGIDAKNALGVSMANLQLIAKRLGRSHDLAAALWDTGCYEARMLASLLDVPALVTPQQMDRWCRDFDNWAICDTVCFKLFDRNPHAWSRVEKWSALEDEFGKRAAFALLASLAGHDRSAADQPFLDGLRLIERASVDERNFVWKGVSWALRSIGRRNPALRAAALDLSHRLADSVHAAARWIGKDALRDLNKSAAKKRATPDQSPKRAKRAPPNPAPGASTA